MCKEALLSQYDNVGLGCNIHKSFNNDRKVNSLQVSVNALCSASAKDREIVFCFFVCQEMREDSKKHNNL